MALLRGSLAELGVETVALVEEAAQLCIDASAEQLDGSNGYIVERHGEAGQAIKRLLQCGNTLHPSVRQCSAIVAGAVPRTAQPRLVLYHNTG